MLTVSKPLCSVKTSICRHAAVLIAHATADDMRLTPGQAELKEQMSIATSRTSDKDDFRQVANTAWQMFIPCCKICSQSPGANTTFRV